MAKVNTSTDSPVTDRHGRRWRIVLREEGTIIYANESFERLTGHDPSSVIGKTPRILQGTGTDEKVIARLSNALKSGRKFEGKAINYKHDGTPFIMFWRVLPIKVGEKIIAWVAIQREGSVI